jgi:hypothetical protein
MCSDLRNVDECYPPHPRCDLIENFQPFPGQLGFEIVEPGDISTRSRPSA